MLQNIRITAKVVISCFPSFSTVIFFAILRFSPKNTSLQYSLQTLWNAWVRTILPFLHMLIL